MRYTVSVAIHPPRGRCTEVRGRELSEVAFLVHTLHQHRADHPTPTDQSNFLHSVILKNIPELPFGYGVETFDIPTGMFAKLVPPTDHYALISYRYNISPCVGVPTV